MGQFSKHMALAIAAYVDVIASQTARALPRGERDAAIDRGVQRAISLAATHFSTDDADKLHKVLCAYRGLPEYGIGGNFKRGAFIVIAENHNSHDYLCGVAQLVVNANERQAVGLDTASAHFKRGNHFAENEERNRNAIRLANPDEIRDWAAALRERADRMEVSDSLTAVIHALTHRAG